jgi:hypothetical protein
MPLKSICISDMALSITPHIHLAVSNCYFLLSVTPIMYGQLSVHFLVCGNRHGDLISACLFPAAPGCPESHDISHMKSAHWWHIVLNGSLAT